MTQQLIPRNEHDMDVLFAKSLAKSFMSTKRYSDERLEEELEKREATIRRHARMAMEAVIESGQILFAIRQRKGYGEWHPWLESKGIHYKAAEKRIKVAQWWRFFPELNPDTGLPWSLSSAYDALPRIKDAVWEQHGIGEHQRLGPVEMGDLEEPEDLVVKPSAECQRNGRRDPAIGIRRKLDNVTADLRHQILAMERRDMLELVAKAIADLQDLMDEAEGDG